MFKGSVTREWRRVNGAYGEGSRHGEKELGAGKKKQCSESSNLKVWAPNYWDVICFNADELAIRENYVRANPRRWALRSVAQGRFEQLFYKGNLGLLKMNVPRRILRVSRRSTKDEVAKLQSDLAIFDGVVCSTFFSAGERACLKILLASKKTVVWVLPMGLPASIPTAWTELFLENRALWISEFPVEMQEATRASCEQGNRRVKRICDGGCS